MKSIEWIGDRVRMIDQTRLPLEEVYIETSDYLEIVDAIKKLKIRGAPAIGIAAAFGFALAAHQFKGQDWERFDRHLKGVAGVLLSTRPTAVNLSWAVNKMRCVLLANSNRAIEEVKVILLAEAQRTLAEDIETCKRIGEHGSSLVPERAGILTHCNTGALATGDYGTAQSVIVKAHENGKKVRVFVDETRPLLQGARLTTWELMKRNINTTLITDSTAAFVMKKGWVDLVVVGADRIARNGDVANKIGTYNLAVLAEKHRIPFYVAAPISSIDFEISSGEGIPIEERDPSEVTESFGRRIAPEGVHVYSPAFDITPNELVTAIVTEHGIVRPPYNNTIPPLHDLTEA
ncbi:MAG: S-methyl-5-thioribose-1-phosphate isomerase [Bacteroidota bacterium]